MIGLPNPDVCVDCGRRSHDWLEHESDISPADREEMRALWELDRQDKIHGRGWHAPGGPQRVAAASSLEKHKDNVSGRRAYAPASRYADGDGAEEIQANRHAPSRSRFRHPTGAASRRNVAPPPR